MANTYSQIYLHLIFVVKDRINLIKPEWKDNLYKYIHGIINHQNQRLISINGPMNHVHLLIGIKSTCVLPDLIREIKSSSTKFINENNWAMGKFHWQKGSGIFSVSHSQLEKTSTYIYNQEEHHKQVLFEDEYKHFLNSHDITFEEKYLFD